MRETASSRYTFLTGMQRIQEDPYYETAKATQRAPDERLKKQIEEHLYYRVEITGTILEDLLEELQEIAEGVTKLSQEVERSRIFRKGSESSFPEEGPRKW